jgi:hypothetical protein
MRGKCVRVLNFRLKWDQRAEALEIFLSPGSPANTRVLRLMRDMHPSPRQITPGSESWPPGNTGRVAKALDALLSTDHTAMTLDLTD